MHGEHPSKWPPCCCPAHPEQLREADTPGICLRAQRQCCQQGLLKAVHLHISFSTTSGPPSDRVEWFVIESITPPIRSRCVQQQHVTPHAQIATPPGIAYTCHTGHSRRFVCTSVNIYCPKTAHDACMLEGLSGCRAVTTYQQV
jgi:hypothetical protein